MQPILEVRGITKAFPGVLALNHVDLDIYPGEVHAVVGENGAGKSTLMKVLTGVYTRDEGEYLFEGKPATFRSIQESIDMGISCIYQELTIAPMVSVAKNLFLGHLPTNKFGKIDYKKLNADAQEVLQLLGLNISPRTLACKLSVAQRQMLEIGRAVSRNAKVIIMDEPTSSLSKKEAEVLFDVIRTLKKRGTGIFYISHKLEEITEISDRISVFRDGQNIATFPNDAAATQERIIQHMIGRTINDYYNKQPHEIGAAVLEAKHLTRRGVFEDVSFDVRSGEVLGFFGLVGAGRSEVITALFGVDKLDSGEIYMDGKRVNFRSARSAIRAGIGLIPEDRREQGLCLRQSVLFNEVLIKMKQLSRFGVCSKASEDRCGQEYRERLNIKTPDLNKKVGELSGGNQQKVVIAKWLMMSPRVLILDEPTRGIDVGAKTEIYRLINELAGAGMAVIIISSELPEVLGLSDRIVVMSEGQVTSIFSAEEANSHVLMEAALKIVNIHEQEGGGAYE